jgi:hypothetical protein
LCDERVYENDVAARLRALGFTDIHTQVPVTVTHGDFSKTYFLDLVVNQMDSLAGQMKELLQDWGAFFEARLYEEVLIHFYGGEPASVTRIPLSRDGIPLGSHRVACHAENTAFLVTAITGSPLAYQSHLRRLLRLTGLHTFQWLNLNHTELQLVTIENGMNGKGMEAEE